MFLTHVVDVLLLPTALANLSLLPRTKTLLCIMVNTVFKRQRQAGRRYEKQKRTVLLS